MNFSKSPFADSYFPHCLKDNQGYPVHGQMPGFEMSKVRLLESHFRTGSAFQSLCTGTGSQETHFHRAECEHSSRPQNTSNSHDTASQRWAKPLCLPVQCSQSTCAGEVVQQWGPWSGTGFPAAHHLKGSRTYKHREKYEERLCLLQQQEQSAGIMGNKPFAKDTAADCSLISLYLCR